MLTEEEKPDGLLLNEVDNLDDLLDDRPRAEFSDLIEQAFNKLVLQSTASHISSGPRVQTRSLLSAGKWTCGRWAR